MPPFEVTALVPAAGEGTRLQDIAFSKPKPLVPVCGKPVISWVVGALVSQGFSRITFVVPHPPNVDPIANYIRDVHSGLCDPSFVHQSRRLGPLHAITQGLRKAKGTGLLIFLADTICFEDLTKLPLDRSWVLACKVNDRARWCLVSHRDGVAEQLFDKSAQPVAADLALIGVYYFHDREVFAQCAGQAMRRRALIEGEYQLSSAISLYMKRYPVRVVETREWHDCGSIENLRQAGDILLARKARAFNRLELRPGEGRIVKSAVGQLGVSTLAEEVGYYRAITDTYAGFFPRVFEASVGRECSRVVLEYWPLPNLADLFVFDRYSTILWKDVGRNVARLLASFRSASQHATLQQDVHEMLWSKTLRRVRELEQQNFLLARTEVVEVNGRRLKGWPLLAAHVNRLVDAAAARPIPGIIHGDLCFSNILCDIGSGLTKLVDPRGSFGSVRGMFGDQRYDLAKLRQSYHGRYDFIINELYKLSSESGDRFKFEIQAREYHRNVGGVLDRELLSGPVVAKDVELIEGLLFLSMGPLHYESRRRQTALWLRGIEVLNDRVLRES